MHRAGSNDLVITYLPIETLPNSIRMTAEEGTKLGTYALRTDRLPPELMPETPEQLAAKRGVLVSQYSGEDWAGVALTLSTAMPSSQSAPSTLWADLRRIEPEVTEEERLAKAATGVDVLAEPVREPAVVDSDRAATMIEGDVVVYKYPTPVNVATGVENLRLALDEIKAAPEIVAQAVPRFDTTAFMMATITNDTGEILLPGPAYLFREGTLVGSADIKQTAPGMEVELPFGAIEGLRLKRDMPVTAEGDRGVFTTSTQREETAVLEVENLTDEAWPMRLIDRVPYSEQEDLSITYTAGPAPTEVNVDGQRGILAWEFEIAPGKTATVDLTTVIQWPEGMMLQ